MRHAAIVIAITFYAGMLALPAPSSEVARSKAREAKAFIDRVLEQAAAGRSCRESFPDVRCVPGEEAGTLLIRDPRYQLPFFNSELRQEEDGRSLAIALNAESSLRRAAGGGGRVEARQTWEALESAIREKTKAWRADSDRHLGNWLRTSPDGAIHLYWSVNPGYYASISRKGGSELHEKAGLLPTSPITPGEARALVRRALAQAAAGKTPQESFPNVRRVPGEYEGIWLVRDPRFQAPFFTTTFQESSRRLHFSVPIAEVEDHPRKEVVRTWEVLLAALKEATKHWVDDPQRHLGRYYRHTRDETLEVGWMYHGEYAVEFTREAPHER